MTFGKKESVSLEDAVLLAAESIVQEIGINGNGRPVCLSNFNSHGDIFSEALSNAGYNGEVSIGERPNIKTEKLVYDVNVMDLIKCFGYTD